MTERQLQVLRKLASGEAEDILCNGIECWVGDELTNRQTVNDLIMLTAISAVDGMKEEYYEINETGRALLRRPELARDITIALRVTKKPFTIKNDQVVYI